MRVLFLCHRIPYPPDKGEKIRAFHQLRAIAQRHEVDLFTLADPRDLQHASALRPYCRRSNIIAFNSKRARLRVLPRLFGDTPLSVTYFYSRELDLEIRNALRRYSYDRIFVYCSSMAQYIPGAHDIPALLDIVDVDSDKWRQYASFTSFPYSAIYQKEARSLESYERTLYNRFPVLVTTPREAGLVRQAAPSSSVHVIPNGVDIDYFNPAQFPAASNPPGIVFVGDMAYFPNEQAVTFFARKVLPLIRNSLPQVRFYIVGRDPGANVRGLQEIPGVIVTGGVPDVRPYLAQAQVSVAPFSIATGIQNKILEAMAYALPVVGTPRAVQGLSKAVAEVIEVGNTAEELAARVCTLLRDPQLARTKGIDGRQRVATEYNWQQSMDRLLDLLETPSGYGVAEERLAAAVSS
jgi:sugar transferase (PEP-CTERM/EpsH1 system associated)